MFELGLLIAAVLVVLYLAVLMISAPFRWIKERSMRKDLNAMGVECEHLSGAELQLLHAETGLETIRKAQRGNA